MGRPRAATYKVVERIPVLIDGREWQVEVRLSSNIHSRVRLLQLAKEAIANRSRRRQLAGGLITFVAVESPEEKEEGCDSPSQPPNP